MINSLKKYNIFIILGAFCLIYNPPIFPFNSMHAVGVVSIFYLLLNPTESIRLLSYKKVFFMFCFFIVLAIYLTLVALISVSGGINIAVTPIYFVLDIIPFGMMLCIYMRKRSITVEDFIILLIFISFIQAVLMAFSFFNPALKDWFISRMLAYGYGEVYTTLSVHRMFGFASGLTYATPALQSFMAVIALIMVRKKQYRYAVVALVMFLFAFVNARLSVIVLAVGLLVFVLLSKMSSKKKIGILLLMGIITFIFIAVLLPIIKERNYMTYTWLMSGIEEIILFLNGNVSGYFSYLDSRERYELPKTFFSFMFGCGHNIMGGDDLYGVSSDIGYINDIWRGGLVYAVVLYSFMMRQFWNLYKYDDKTISLIGIFAFVLFPILNIKGSIYSMNNLTVAIFLLIIVCTASKLQKPANKKFRRI